MRGLRCQESGMGIVEFGHISVYEMCGAAPEVGDSRVEGEELVHGQLERGAGREHEEGGQPREQ